MRPLLSSSLVLTGTCLSLLFSGNAQAQRSDYQWCVVDEEKGAYTSQCYKRKARCQQEVQIAAEKFDRRFSCGVSAS